MAEKIIVPTLGESVTEATVSKWLKNQGEKVVADEPIVELETDKVNVEVPAPSNGVLSNIAVKEGETVNVGSLLGTINGGTSAQSAVKEVKKYRDKMVARNYPFQAISDIITKYEIENPPVAIENDDRGPLDMTRLLEEKDREIARLTEKLCQCDA